MNSQTYYIGICDDEVVWKTTIYDLCQRFCKNQNYSVEFELFSSGKELLAHSGQLDILFLDEEMPEISGQKIKEIYELQHRKTMIVFITSHTDIIYDAFGANVYGFLPKPIEASLLFAKLTSLFQKLNTQSSLYLLDTNNCKIKIPCQLIQYIIADNNYATIIHGNGKQLLSRVTLNDIERENHYKYLIRIHKSYMVNLWQQCKLDRMGSSITCLIDGRSFPIARRRRKQVEALYSELLSEKAESIWNISYMK